MLCVEVAIQKCAGVAQTRAVMTIREKFADLKFLMSKYKDFHMVLLFIGIQRILNITESIPSSKRGREVVQ